MLSQSHHEAAMLLWQSRRAVVIGRNQNIWSEVSPRYTRHQRIAVARRESGGGAVYHDSGNLNFALFVPRRSYSLEHNFEFLINSLYALGIKAKRGASNSVMVQGRKISGSAFRLTKECAMHHGTLLINSNTTHLRRALSPDCQIRHNRGIASRRASVVNTRALRRGLTLEAVRRSLIENVVRWPLLENSPPRVERLQKRAIYSDSDLQRRAAVLRSWGWVVGRSPRCSLILEEGGASSGHRFHLDITVEWGVITELQLHTPHSERSTIERLLQSRLGQRTIAPPLRSALARVRADLRATSARSSTLSAADYRLLERLLKRIGGLIVCNVIGRWRR